MDCPHENRRNILYLVLLSFLCWGGLLTLKGIWWDDWAWVWVYFSSKGMSGFMLPFESLRKEMEGTLIYSFFGFLKVFRINATQIWNVLKFAIFTLNAVLLYLTIKTIQLNKSVLPESIAVAYLVSPIVNNLCSVNIVYFLEITFFFLSMFFSVRAAKENDIKGLDYKLSFLFALFPIMALGTYIFFDLLRAVIVFYVLVRLQNIKRSKALKRTALFHSPFLLAGACALLYTKLMPQYGIYANAYAIKEHGLTLLSGVIERYLATFMYFVRLYTHSAVGVYKSILSINILPSIIAACLVLLFLIKKEKTLINDSGEYNVTKEIKAYAFFGILAMLVGSFPYVMVGKVPSFGLNSRHAILANIGLCILIPSLLLMFYKKNTVCRWICFVLFSVFVLLGISQCSLELEAYRNDWKQQQSFWSEFIKRVPDIRDNTLLIVDIPRNRGGRTYLDSNSDYIYSAPLNFMYAKSENDLRKHYAINIVRYVSMKHYDKVEVQFLSFQGVQKFYPRNLIAASFNNGKLYLNDEINESNSKHAKQIKLLLSKKLGNQIIDKKNAEFPFRWIIGK